MSDPAATPPARNDEVAQEPCGGSAAELAETKDRLLRALADTENLRRQAKQEREEAVHYAAAEFAADLLATADNLERAIQSVPADECGEGAVASLLGGIEATRRALLDAFSRHGLIRFDPLGQPFDPHRHQASFEIVDAQFKPGTVARVMQPGYLYHDRLLRPALVSVSKDAAPSGQDNRPDGSPPETN